MLRLAAHYHATPSELLARFSSSELSEMMAFDREYGLPDAYFVVAQLCRATLSPWAKEPVKAEDFVPYFAPPREKQTVADHKARFARFALAPQPAPKG